MFESITIRSSYPHSVKIDLGILAECLLFYGKVYIVAEMGVLRSLVEGLGLEVLEKLVDDNYIDLKFKPAISATLNRNSGTHSEYFDFINVTKVSPNSPDDNYEYLFFEMLEKGSGKRGKSRRVGKRLIERVEFISPASIDSDNILNTARSDLANDAFVKDVVEIVIGYFAPKFKFPVNWYFHTVRIDKGFDIITNLDINELNNSLKEPTVIGPSEIITKSFLIDWILKVNQDIYFAAKYTSDLITNPFTTSIINKKSINILRKSLQNIQEIELFQNVFMDNSRQLKEVINSGERSFSDLFPILEKSKKFKSWIIEQGHDSNLIREYYRDVTSNTWIDRLPGKVIRFCLFQLVLGKIPIVGDLLSAFDTFILENTIVQNRFSIRPLSREPSRVCGKIGLPDRLSNHTPGGRPYGKGIQPVQSTAQTISPSHV